MLELFVIFVFVLGVVAVAILALRKIRRPASSGADDLAEDLRKRRDDKIIPLRELIGKDQWPEDEQMLDRLWDINVNISGDAMWEGISPRLRLQIEQQFNRIFWICADDLERGYYMLQRADDVADELRKRTLTSQQKKMLAMIGENVTFLQNMISRIQDLKLKKRHEEPEAILHDIRQRASAFAKAHAK